MMSNGELAHPLWYSINRGLNSQTDKMIHGELIISLAVVINFICGQQLTSWNKLIIPLIQGCPWGNKTSKYHPTPHL